MFTRLLRRDRQVNVSRLYGAIVAQARAPGFYADYGVPDTVAGRFDLLALHVHLFMRRLNGGDASSRAAGQALVERFFEDMDGNLRELGVSDLSVPRQMRGLAEAFYGRVDRYDAALEERGERALAAALLRNVFGERDEARAGAERLARYVRRTEESLAACAVERIVAGAVELPRPEEV
jgi:cytochrome b pre-mRNA-processing protein 3